MGVYIPNMDKPKNCMDCIVEEYADCDVWKGVDSASNYKDSRYPKCPLIEIGDIEYQAYKEIMTMLLTKIEDRILYGERRE